MFPWRWALCEIRGCGDQALVGSAATRLPRGLRSVSSPPVGIFLWLSDGTDHRIQTASLEAIARRAGARSAGARRKRSRGIAQISRALSQALPAAEDANAADEGRQRG